MTPQPTRLLCPWDSPGKNTGVDRHALLQGIFLTRGSNLPLLPWRAGSLYCASREAALFRGVFSGRKDEKVSRKTKPCAGYAHGTGISCQGWTLPGVALGSSPSPANRRSEGWPRMEGCWAYVPEVEKMLWVKSAHSQPRQRAARRGDPGHKRRDPQVGDGVLQAGLD